MEIINVAKNYSLEDLKKTGVEESFDVLVTEDIMQRFFEVCGDISPIHRDAEFAKKQGFEERVVYGMCTASFYSTLVGTYLPGRRCLLQECNAQFTKPVYVGDKLTVKGCVDSVNEKLRCITIKAEIRNQNGVKVSRAKIIVGLLEEKE